jgi:hypothetical protein
MENGGSRKPRCVTSQLKKTRMVFFSLFLKC